MKIQFFGWLNRHISFLNKQLLFYTQESKTYYVKASHATGCAARPRSTTPTFVTKFQDKFAYTPSASAYFQGGSISMSPIPTSAEAPRSNQLTPEPAHRPSHPIPPRPAIQTTTNVKAEMTSTSTTSSLTTYEE